MPPRVLGLYSRDSKFRPNFESLYFKDNNNNNKKNKQTKNKQKQTNKQTNKTKKQQQKPNKQNIQAHLHCFLAKIL